MASPADIQEWRDYFPELSVLSLTDAYINRRLDEAEEICGKGYKRRWFYLTAHLIAYYQGVMNGTIKADAGFGEHTQETVGKMSVTLKSMADRGLDTFFTTTPFGRMYLALRDTSVSRILSVRIGRGCC